MEWLRRGAEQDLRFGARSASFDEQRFLVDLANHDLAVPGHLPEQ
ncbi:hypothetical protein [Rhodococcus sp. SMB37]|nr:hypothetical protein [Rhodococcus sp. SMB37]